jgi:hypothetical protein
VLPWLSLTGSPPFKVASRKCSKNLIDIKSPDGASTHFIVAFCLGGNAAGTSRPNFRQLFLRPACYRRASSPELSSALEST